LQATARQKSSISGSLMGLRIILSLHLFGVLIQAAAAGQFLSGAEGPVVFHEFTAWAILGLSLVQCVLAALWSRRGGPLWFVIASIFLLVAETLQTGSGYGRFLSVHVPLGVILFGGVLWLLVWVFRRPAQTGIAA